MFEKNCPGCESFRTTFLIMEPQPMRSMRKIEDSLVNCVGIYNLRSGIGPRWHLRGPTANLHSAQFSRENIKRQTMFQSERNGVAHQVRRNTIMATLQQRSKSVGENELPLMPKPKSNRLPSLQFLASSSIITVIETGFIGIKSAGGPPKDPKEVRARLFNYDARCASHFSKYTNLRFQFFLRSVGARRELARALDTAEKPKNFSFLFRSGTERFIR